MLNNHAFVLLDSLIGFFILAIISSLFMKVITIDYQLLNETKQHIKVLDTMRMGIHNDYQILTSDGIITSKSGDKYCASKNQTTHCLYYK